MNSLGKLVGSQPLENIPVTPGRTADAKAASRDKTKDKQARRTERHDRLGRRTKIQPARAELFRLQKLEKLAHVDKFLLASGGELSHDDIRAIAPLLESAGVFVEETKVEGHPEQARFLLLGEKKIIRPSLDRIDNSISLLMRLGIARPEACALLASDMKAMLTGRAVGWKITGSGKLRLRGKQDISKVQEIFRTLVHCGHPRAAIRLLKAAPSPVQQRCLILDGSLFDCFEALGEHKASFAEMMLPALASVAVHTANAGSADALDLLGSAPDLAIEATRHLPLARLYAARDQVHAALGQLIFPHEGEGDRALAENTKQRLLRVLQTMLDTAGAELPDSELRVQIDELRQLVATGPEETRSERLEELGALELSYIQSVSDDLKKQFGDALKPKDFGHLTLECARSLHAAKALIDLAEFALGSPEPGIATHGAIMLDTLKELEWSGFKPDERAAIEGAIKLAVEKMVNAPKSGPAAAEDAPATLLALLQLVHYPAGADVSQDDLQGEIALRRELQGHMPKEPELIKLARDQLQTLEDAYQEATSPHLIEDIMNVGNSKPGDVKAMKAAEAVLSSVDFSIESQNPEIVRSGRFALDALENFVSEQADSGELSAFHSKLQGVKAKGFAMQIAAGVNAADSADALKSVETAAKEHCSDEVLSIACKVFSSTRVLSSDAAAIWKKVAVAYLDEAVPRLTHGDPSRIAEAIVSTPGVRDALEILAGCGENALQEFLGGIAGAEAGDFMTSVAGAVLATTPALARDKLFPAVNAVAGIDDRRWPSSQFVLLAAATIQHPQGVKNLAELIKTIEFGVPADDAKKWVTIQKRKSDVQEMVTSLIATSQPPDPGAADAHAKLLRDAYAVCIANPAMHANFEEFKRAVAAEASADRKEAIGFVSEEMNELAQRIGAALADDVPAALKALARAPQTVGPGLWKILSNSKLEQLAANAMQAAILRGDTPAAAEIFTDLRTAVKSLGREWIAVAATRAALAALVEEGPGPAFEFMYMLIRGGMSRDELTNLTALDVLNQSFFHAKTSNVQKLFVDLLEAARAASFSRTDQGDLLAQALGSAIEAYKRGSKNAHELIAVLTPMLREYRDDFDAAQRAFYERARSFTTGVSFKRAFFEFEKQLYG